MLIPDKFEVNITDLIQERLGNSIYTTILAQYSGLPEKLLQWYVNGRPVGPSNTIYNVKSDGLNSYLRFKHDDNQTYGTFMLKVNGSNMKDTLNIPNLQEISNLLGSSRSFLKKIVTKVVNGNLLSDIKAIPDTQTDTSSNKFLSQNNYKSGNRKFLPGIIRLGVGRKPNMDSWKRNRNGMKSFVPTSPITPLNLRKLKQYSNLSKFVSKEQ